MRLHIRLDYSLLTNDCAWISVTMAPLNVVISTLAHNKTQKYLQSNYCNGGAFPYNFEKWLYSHWRYQFTTIFLYAKFIVRELPENWVSSQTYNFSEFELFVCLIFPLLVRILGSWWDSLNQFTYLWRVYNCIFII